MTITSTEITDEEKIKLKKMVARENKEEAKQLINAAAFDQIRDLKTQIQTIDAKRLNDISNLN